MPRTKEQFAALRERSRARILKAAIELFAARGFHATTIAAIAQKARVATGLMYNYFDTKDELLEAILQGTRQELATLVAEQLRHTPAGDIRAFMEGFLPRIKDRIPVWRMILSITLHQETKHVSRKAPAGFDRLLMSATAAGMTAPGGRGRWNARQTAEMLHTILVGYCVTQNEGAARRLIALLEA